MEISPPSKWYPLRFRDDETLEPQEGAPYLTYKRATGRTKAKVEQYLAERRESLSGGDTTIREQMADDDSFDLIMKVCVKHVTGSYSFEFEGQPVSVGDLPDYPPREWMDEYKNDPIEEYSEPTKYGVLNRLGQGAEAYMALWELHKSILNGLTEEQKKISLMQLASIGQTENTSDAPAPSATDKQPSQTNDSPTET